MSNNIKTGTEYPYPITIYYKDGTSETIDHPPVTKLEKPWRNIFKALLILVFEFLLCISIIGIPLCHYLRNHNMWFKRPFGMADYVSNGWNKRVWKWDFDPSGKMRPQDYIAPAENMTFRSQSASQSRFMKRRHLKKRHKLRMRINSRIKNKYLIKKIIIPLLKNIKRSAQYGGFTAPLQIYRFIDKSPYSATELRDILANILEAKGYYLDRFTVICGGLFFHDYLDILVAWPHQYSEEED